MNTLLWTLPFLMLACFIWWIFNREKRYRKALLQNDFESASECPIEIEELSQVIFDTKPEHDFHRGKSISKWGQDTWLVNVDPGGDDTSFELLSFKIKAQNLPMIIITPTVGVSRTSGLVGWIVRMSAPFKTAGLRLLPDEFQPHLSRNKGLLVFADREVHAEEVLPASILAHLKTSDCSYLGGFGLFGTRAALWTASRSKFAQMLDLADFIRSQL
jgi:hypothetical protein